MASDKIKDLTQQQMTILERVVQGKTNYVIACDLGISERTVKCHVNKIHEHLGVHNRTAAAVAYLKYLNPGMKTNALGM
ncbi:LuxR C-terminal-related transcriptional regulator [Neptuniibacter sp.]|uniref:response regulator transcription factor n=1 Tax=Neptuniibacter sp. TaxID=1962643 RepID=UPI002636AE3B|nr:LuxR C-terminal-related transcriptional regulator [Neptuniibacter sp.]MCP4596163.1 response regulator transcription factor [Neptuniibacter sp.]